MASLCYASTSTSLACFTLFQNALELCFVEFPQSLLYPFEFSNHFIHRTTIDLFLLCFLYHKGNLSCFAQKLKNLKKVSFAPPQPDNYTIHRKWYERFLALKITKGLRKRSPHFSFTKALSSLHSILLSSSLLLLQVKKFPMYQRSSRETSLQQ